MNNTFKANLLKSLANKKGNKGFTLIELLVVVIIIGVLAAIALPNLLGQVGKARESEAKSTLGAMTRAQQGFFTEKGRFAGDTAFDGATPEELTDALEVPTGNEKFYYIRVVGPGLQIANGGTDADADGKIAASETGGTANGANGTRDYIAGIGYDPENRIFDSAVCRAASNATMKAAQYVLAAGTNDPNNTNGSALNIDVTCGTDTEEVK